MARPEFNPTDEQRRSVELMAAAGMIRDKIAAALGISTPTLEKHCMVEITSGAAQRRAHIIGKLYEKADEGNVTAMKAFLALEGGASLAVDEGKKAERQRVAETAGKGTVWEEIQKQH